MSGSCSNRKIEPTETAGSPLRLWVPILLTVLAASAHVQCKREGKSDKIVSADSGDAEGIPVNINRIPITPPNDADLSSARVYLQHAEEKTGGIVDLRIEVAKAYQELGESTTAKKISSELAPTIAAWQPSSSKSLSSLKLAELQLKLGDATGFRASLRVTVAASKDALLGQEFELRILGDVASLQAEAGDEPACRSVIAELKKRLSSVRLPLLRGGTAAALRVEDYESAMLFGEASKGIVQIEIFMDVALGAAKAGKATVCTTAVNRAKTGCAAFTSADMRDQGYGMIIAAMCKMGKTEEARQLLPYMSNSEVTIMAICFNLAEAFVRDGQREKAFALLQEAIVKSRSIREQDGRVRSLNLIGELQAKLGDVAAARRTAAASGRNGESILAAIAVRLSGDGKLQEYVDVLGDVRDPEIRARACAEIATHEYQRGQRQAAKAQLDEAEKCMSRVTGSYDVIRLREQLAATSIGVGDSNRGLRLAEGAQAAEDGVRIYIRMARAAAEARNVK